MLDLSVMPMYADLEEKLRRRIADGTYGVGESLPSESSLAAEFGVSRFTAREALRRLRDAGLIHRQQGARSKVIGDQGQPRYTFYVGSAEDLRQYAHDTRLAISSVTPVQARGSLGRFLRCRDKREWLRLSGLRVDRSSESVVGFTEVYLWAEFEPQLAEITKHGAPIHEQIEDRLGVATAFVRQEITAIPMPPEAAEPLGVEPGTPALEIVRRYFGGPGRAFEVARNVHTAGSFTYSQEFRRGGGHETRSERQPLRG